MLTGWSCTPSGPVTGDRLSETSPGSSTSLTTPPPNTLSTERRLTICMTNLFSRQNEIDQSTTCSTNCSIGHEFLATHIRSPLKRVLPPPRSSLRHHVDSRSCRISLLPARFSHSRKSTPTPRIDRACASANRQRVSGVRVPCSGRLHRRRRSVLRFATRDWHRLPFCASRYVPAIRSR